MKNEDEINGEARLKEIYALLDGAKADDKERSAYLNEALVMSYIDLTEREESIADSTLGGSLLGLVGGGYLGLWLSGLTDVAIYSGIIFAIGGALLGNKLEYKLNNPKDIIKKNVEKVLKKYRL